MAASASDSGTAVDTTAATGAGITVTGAATAIAAVTAERFEVVVDTMAVADTAVARFAAAVAANYHARVY
jgi:hypothetical protein